jgi:hypothetical protein
MRSHAPCAAAVERLPPAQCHPLLCTCARDALTPALFFLLPLLFCCRRTRSSSRSDCEAVGFPIILIRFWVCFCFFFFVRLKCAVGIGCAHGRYFWRMRTHALRVMNRTYMVGEWYPLQKLTHNLLFDSEHEAADFCVLHGLAVHRPGLGAGAAPPPPHPPQVSGGAPLPKLPAFSGVILCLKRLVCLFYPPPPPPFPLVLQFGSFQRPLFCPFLFQSRAPTRCNSTISKPRFATPQPPTPPPPPPLRRKLPPNQLSRPLLPLRLSRTHTSFTR